MCVTRIVTLKNIDMPGYIKQFCLFFFKYVESSETHFFLLFK
jgi:hypothetical protein